jgi:hypothetical protein
MEQVYVGRAPALTGLVVREQAATFGFGEAAPDAMRLAYAEREVETLALHRAVGADELRLRFACVAVVASFGDRRREEQQ